MKIFYIRIDSAHTSGLISKWISDETNEFLKTNDSQFRRCVMNRVKSFDTALSTEDLIPDNDSIPGIESVVFKISAMKLFLKIYFSLILFCLSTLMIEIFIKNLYLFLYN